jgi:hypothetical protein
MKQFLKSKALRYILYLLAVLPIFIFRDFTLDNELRYLSIADEALRNGSFFTFTNHGNVYADKPPLYFWIVMAGKILFGTHSLLFLGMFSFIPALVVIYVMDQWVENLLSKNERLTGELLLLTSVFYIGTALVLRMDMLMCMFIVLSLYTFFKMYSGTAKPWDSFLFPVYVFMALFSKGPLGIIVPLVSTTLFLSLKKEINSIGRYWGWKTLLILLTLCGIWFAGVYAESRSPYLYNLLFNQTVNRAVNSFHHQEPFYYYFAAIWYSLAPWSLLYIGIWILGIQKKLASTDLELFFLVIALSTWVILSLFSSKLAVYMLPIFPFVVYLSVLWLSRIDPPKWIFLLVIIPASLLCMALPGMILSYYFGIAFSWLVLLAALILSVTGIITVINLSNRYLNRGIITMSAGILVAAFTLSFAIPQYNSMIGLSELCDHAKTISSSKGVANYYYCKFDRAENLDIYLGVQLQKLKLNDLFEIDTPIKKPAVLFLWHKAIDRSDSLKQFIKGKRIVKFGNYCCVEIDI